MRASSVADSRREPYSLIGTSRPLALDQTDGKGGETCIFESGEHVSQGTTSSLPMTMVTPFFFSSDVLFHRLRCSLFYLSGRPLLLEPPLPVFPPFTATAGARERVLAGRWVAWQRAHRKRAGLTLLARHEPGGSEP